MKLTSIFAGSAIAALALCTNIGGTFGLPQMMQAEAAVTVGVNVFYDRLAGEGDWVRYRDDYVFIPANVQRGWKPYTVGRWVYADRVGWTWSSDESFGWATYHYGRWGYADEIGWYWVPGTRWAPAWVSWKRSPDYVVWAPLPPRGRSNDVSVSVSVGDVPDFYWVAVPTKRFLEPNIRIAVVNNDVERRRIVRRADVIGTVRVENNIVVNTVINVDLIERESGRKVKRVKIRDTENPAEARATADEVTVFRGEVKDAADAKPKRVRDVSEARKIRRDDAAAGSADTQQADEPNDATGTTTRQNSKDRNNAAAPSNDSGNGAAAGTADEQQGNKTKPEVRRKKAAGNPDQPSDKNAVQNKGNGAKVTVPEKAQNGKAKADDNRQKAQQKRKAAPNGQNVDDGQTKAKPQKQKAAPDEDSQKNGQKVQRNRQQQGDQGGAQPNQRKKGKQQNCDPSDPSCAQ